MTAARPPLFTVAVCTYNRAALLRDVLGDLCAQTLPREHYEILVVDNNSTDDTAAVAREFAARGVRRVAEPAQGLSHARNRAWREARGEYVAYCDDDCRIPPGWLEAARTLALAHRPEGMGGPYFACYASPRPAWFKDAYGSHDQGPERVLGPGEFLDGGNMILQRAVLEALGGFDGRLGMRGRALGYGEETDLQLRLRAARPGAALRYSPALWVRHLVSPGRMRLGDILRQRLADGMSIERIRLADGPPPPALRAAGALGKAAGRVALALAALPLRDREAMPRVHNGLCELVGPRVLGLGMAWARLRAALEGRR